MVPKTREIANGKRLTDARSRFGALMKEYDAKVFEDFKRACENG